MAERGGNRNGEERPKRSLRGRAGRMQGGRGSGRASAGAVRLWGRHAVEAALMNLALKARVVLCGGISSYNDEDPSQMHGIKPYMQLTIQRARMEGFIILDYAARFAEGVQALGKLMAEGKLKTAEDIQHGFENCPATLRRLFEGKNLGKQLLKLTDPPLPVV